MAKKKPIRIGFLWHMHQPWYFWSDSNEAALPWVRLHALKDYYDMALIAEQTGFPVTINLVPSLLKQIDMLASGKGTDSYWEAFLLEMSDMDESQLDLVVTRFFNVNHQRRLHLSQRFSELFAKKGAANDWRVFSAQEIRDIQVHFILAWFGQSLRETPEIEELLRKDNDFSVENKQTVTTLANKRLKEIIPYYQKLAKNKNIQLTMSPYYHPILPLLCDISIARKSNPLATLPKKPFLYPSDAARQVKMGVDYFNELFGIKPTGLWPSEGSVSEEILSILIENGIKHIFSDEDILRKSLELSHGEVIELTPQRLYQPYRLHRGKSVIDIIFRDKRISDKIGFVYYDWKEEDAVCDFVNSVLRIREALPASDKNHIVSVVLDGENAWEFYQDNGKPFLTMLYKNLLDCEDIEPTTFDKYVSHITKNEVLDRLAPGSWINNDFSTWCGAKEKNAAWELLSETRSHFHLNADRISPSLREKIMQQIMIAEGSDWFWWFGDTNYTPDIDTFDALFRFHLRRVYELMDEPIPPELEKPVQSGDKAYEPVRKPLQFMTPSLEGKATTYFEWSSAGFYKATGFKGTMFDSHGVVLQRLFYGFDPENLYLRLDSSYHLVNFLRQGGRFIFEFLTPERIDIEIFLEKEKLHTQAYQVKSSERKKIHLKDMEVVCDQICEMKVPFAVLNADPEHPIKFVVYIKEKLITNQRFPPGGQFMEITPPDEDFEDRMWYV